MCHLAVLSKRRDTARMTQINQNIKLRATNTSAAASAAAQSSQQTLAQRPDLFERL